MTTNKISTTKPIAKIIALFLALSLTACNIAPASTPSPSAPPATEAILTPTEIPLEFEGEVFSTTDSLPEEIIPFMELFTDMTEEDRLDIDKLGPILWFKAAQGEIRVNYALLQMAIVTDIKDADGEPGNPKPVYYIVYKDKQGQMQSRYALGKLIEKDDKGVSYVTRVLDEQTFRNWQNDTKPEDGSYTVGQIVHYIPLRGDIDVPQARTTQAKLNSGELSSENFMQNYAEGVGFFQPGQEDQLVGVDKHTPEEFDSQPFWQNLFSGLTEVQATGLELSSETPPTPIAEPTQTPKQALEEFKESAEYKLALKTYLSALNIDENSVSINTRQIIVNNEKRLYVIAEPDTSKLPEEIKQYKELYKAVPLFELQNGSFVSLGWKDYSSKPIGAHMTPFYSTDVIHSRTFLQNFDTVLIDGPLHLINTRPTINEFKYDKFNTLINFALNNDLRIETHHLAWGNINFLPDWILNGVYSKEQWKDILKEHVQFTVQSYKGQIDVWSAVNEPQWTFWQEKIGNDWMELVFQWAQEIDPDSKYILNNVRNETMKSKNGAKDLSTIKELVDSKIRVDGVGFQLHIDGSNPPSFEDIQSMMEEYEKIGIAVYITELDIDISKVRGTELERKLKKAYIYQSVIKACLIAANCEQINFFGFTNKVSALENPDSDPLPFSNSYISDISYYSIASELFEKLLPK